MNFWQRAKAAVRAFTASPQRESLGDPRLIRARYDAAMTDGHNTQHWAAADALDADAANSLAVRKRLAWRSRYELANNGQGKGVQLTQANYVVGRGPKLRVQTRVKSFNDMVEARWKRWAAKCKLARKLRTAVKAKVSDGEGILIAFHNPNLFGKGEVQIDLRGIESEQMQTPGLLTGTPDYVDGIKFDGYGNPVHYDVLPYHPGGLWSGVKNFDPEKVPAEFVFHLYREDRPGQHRGIGEMTPSLNLFAQGRRFREATVAAAENIANFSLFLKTQAAPDTGIDQVRPLSTLPIDKSMMVALPMGFDAFQPKAEQPTATYDEFTRSQQCEQARPLNMPYNIAAADSSGYSFSGGKLDHLTYFVSVDVEQADIEDAILEPLFELWFREAVRIYGWAVDDSPLPPHTWDWQRKPVIDETKTANARKIDLSTGAVSLRRIYAEDGYDLEEELEAMAEDYGVSVDELKQRLFDINLPLAGSGASSEPSEDGGDETENGSSRGRQPSSRAGQRNGNWRVRV